MDSRKLRNKGDAEETWGMGLSISLQSEESQQYRSIQVAEQESAVYTHIRTEYIGFEEIDDGVYNVHYCDFLLGRFYEESGRVKDLIERVPIRKRITKESYRRT